MAERGPVCLLFVLLFSIKSFQPCYVLSEDSKLTRPTLEPGNDSHKGNLVRSFNPLFHVFEGEGHVIHILPPERREAGGREGALKVQPVYNLRDLENSHGVAKAVSAAPRLAWLVCSVSVTGLALLFV